MAHAQATRLFRRDVAGRHGKTLDPLLDVPERLKRGLDCLGRDVLQDVGCDGVAQTIEIVDKLAAGTGQEELVGATILGIVPALQKTVLDQTIEQAHQRDRLQFKHVGQIDLRQPLVLPQPEQYDPLRSRRASALGAVVDVIAQQARAFDELRDQLAFQIERQSLERFPKLSNCLEFSSYSVFTH